MKKSWKCVIVLLIVVLMLACAIAGCSDFGDRILCAESYTCEYGELFTTPYVTATTGIEAKVEIFDAEGNTVPVEYGTCSLDKGEYKIVFTAGELTKEVPLYCVDTKAPQIKVTYSASAAVGHWYTLPKANVSDISLVDKNLTIVELFKAGEDTPVASGVGSRFRIGCDHKPLTAVHAFIPLSTIRALAVSYCVCRAAVRAYTAVSKTLALHIYF